jgi:hypothetical protein
MATKNKELAVWAEVVAVPLATTKKGKIVLLLTGVMRLGRDLPQVRIVVVVADSEAAIEEEIGWNEVNFLLESFSFQSECFQLFLLKINRACWRTVFGFIQSQGSSTRLSSFIREKFIRSEERRTF